MATINAVSAHCIAIGAKTRNLHTSIRNMAENGKLSLVFEVEKYFSSFIENELIDGNFKFKKKEGKGHTDRFYIWWGIGAVTVEAE